MLVLVSLALNLGVGSLQQPKIDLANVTAPVRGKRVEIEGRLKPRYLTFQSKELRDAKVRLWVGWGNVGSGIVIPDVFVYRIYSATKRSPETLELCATLIHRRGTPLPELRYDAKKGVSTLTIRYGGSFGGGLVDTLTIDPRF